MSSLDKSVSQIKGRTWVTEKTISYLFLLPAILVLIFVSAYPLLYSLWLSFTETQLIRPESIGVVVGLRNYIDLFRDTIFLTGVRNNLLYALGVVLVEVSLGLFLAFLISVERTGTKIIRSILLLPMMITPVVVGLLWRILLDYRYGLINFILHAIGLPFQNWLSEPTHALIAVMIVDIWQWTPTQTLILLAGIQSLSRDPIRAAQVDGASPFQIFRLITLPMLRPVLITVILIRVIEAFKVFDHIWMMTQGGPGYATEVFTIFIYQQGMSYFKLGYASAAAWILLSFLLLISSYLIPRIRANE